MSRNLECSLVKTSDRPIRNLFATCTGENQYYLFAPNNPSDHAGGLENCGPCHSQRIFHTEIIFQVYGNIHKYAYYFIDLLIGHPFAQRTSVIIDTGSSLCGFPCTTCAHCGRHIDAAYDISKSPSAKWMKCNSKCIMFSKTTLVIQLLS